jgi:hypothetical protein
MTGRTATSWTGSERERSTLRDTCLYPSQKPTPKPVEYHVPSGTRSLTKRVGDREWTPFTTRRDLTFSAPYRETEKSLIFFCAGFLLSVTRQQIIQGP